MAKSRTAKRWTASDVDTLMNSGFDTMTSNQRYKFAKSLNRTEQALYCKYYSTSRERAAAKPMGSIDLTKSTQRVTKTALNDFMAALINHADSAVVENDKVTIYFK